MYKTIFIFMLTFALFSCEDVVEVDLREADQRIVIEAQIETESRPLAIISSTLAYNNQARTAVIEGVEVWITDDEQPPNKVQLTEVNQKGYYTTTNDYFGKVGRVYTLEVMHDGEKYSATDSLKRLPEVENLEVVKNNETDEYYSVFVYAEEPAGMGDNYRWIVYYNGVPLLHPNFMAVTSDQLVDGNYIEKAQILNGQFAGFAMDTEIVDETKIQIKQLSISQDCLEYYMQLQESTSGQGMFSPPPANVPTNFSNGALGFFRASAVAWSAEVTAPYAIADKK